MLLGCSFGIVLADARSLKPELFSYEGSLRPRLYFKLRSETFRWVPYLGTTILSTTQTWASHEIFTKSERKSFCHLTICGVIMLSS
jgi:hypothetical protein